MARLPRISPGQVWPDARRNADALRTERARPLSGLAVLGGYPALFLSVAVITVLGSAFVWKIRSVPDRLMPWRLTTNSRYVLLAG